MTEASDNRQIKHENECMCAQQEEREICARVSTSRFLTCQPLDSLGVASPQLRLSRHIDFVSIHQKPLADVPVTIAYVKSPPNRYMPYWRETYSSINPYIIPFNVRNIKMNFKNIIIRLKNKILLSDCHQ